MAFKGAFMAKNTGKKHRQGSVSGRSQVQNPQNGCFVKRDTNTGRFIAVKKDKAPFKGGAVEPDGRKK